MPEQVSGETVASNAKRSSNSEPPLAEPQSTTREASSNSASTIAAGTERSTLASLAASSPGDERRLLARASALLWKADISDAHLLLEQALEHGSPRVAFMPAETYDARVLQSWRIHGIAGEPAKAPELYERAQARSIEGAKDRIKNSK